MTPRPHAEIIRAWAEGHDVQYRRPGDERWVDCTAPAFVEDYEYRAKPAREYPVVSLNHATMNSAFQKLVRAGYNGAEEFANSTIRHMIDNGQVVTREEFATLLKERDRAVLTLQNACYTDEGGELWRPPLGRTVAGTQRLIDCLRTIRKVDKESVSVIMLWIDGEQVPLGSYITSALKAAGVT